MRLLLCLAAAGAAHAWIQPVPGMGVPVGCSGASNAVCLASAGSRLSASAGEGRLRRGRVQQGGARSLSASGSATLEESGQPRVWNNGQSTKGGAIEASEAAMWHRLRRKAIIEAHPEAKELEGRDWRGGALLLFSNMLQLAIAVACAKLSWLIVAVLGITVGGTLSLWQLTLMHDVIHGNVSKNKRVNTFLLWAGSLPCVFGYFLYLRFGHLSHHNRMGGHSMAELFDSDKDQFEDGDILFVTHRSKIQGEKGPLPPPALQGVIPADRPVNVAWNLFDKLWRDGQPLRNMAAYSLSMMLERLVLVVSDKATALLGFSGFFPNKPASFHFAAANHARLCALFQAALIFTLGWKPFVFLFIAECAWSLPVHPSSAMFVTNHGTYSSPEKSSPGPGGLGPAGECQPTRSTYIGKWYDFVCLNTNFHVEHHDFPNVPILAVPKLKKMAPEFYGEGCVSYGSGIWSTLVEAFHTPKWYSCMGVTTDGERLSSVFPTEEDAPAHA